MRALLVSTVVACASTQPPPASDPAPHPAGKRTSGGYVIVAPGDVVRSQGTRVITPDDGDKVRLSSGARLQASVKVCADATGKIERLVMLDSTPLVTYNGKILRVINATWRYEPHLVDGQPTPFCTAVTFIYTQR